MTKCGCPELSYVGRDGLVHEVTLKWPGLHHSCDYSYRRGRLVPRAVILAAERLKARGILLQHAGHGYGHADYNSAWNAEFAKAMEELWQERTNGKDQSGSEGDTPPDNEFGDANHPGAGEEGNAGVSTGECSAAGEEAAKDHYA